MARACRLACAGRAGAGIVTYLPTVIANRAWYWRRVPRERIIAETSAFILRSLGLTKA